MCCYRKRSSQEENGAVRSTVVEFHEPCEGVLVVGGDQVHLVFGYNESCETGEEDRQGIELFNTQGGGGVGIVMHGHSSWEHREQFLLVSRKPL